MGKLIDLTGKIFGNLTVIRRAEDYVSPKGKRYPKWLCECACEEHNQIVVAGNSLRNGLTTSCGCIQKKRSAANISEMNKKGHYNQYNLQGEYGIGFTSNTHKEFYFDLEDYDKIKNYCWSENDRGYAVAYNENNKKLILMHHVVFLKFVDHKNRNKLDNRKKNLRKCTHSQNSLNKGLKSTNKSGITGVWQRSSDGMWRAKLTVNGVDVLLDFFDNKHDAIVARLKAEKQYCDKFAPQRNLFEKYNI